MNRQLLEDEILDLFQSLMRRVADSHAPEFLGIDLTMSQAKVLYIVSLRPGISMSVLARRLKVGLSAASGLVERLVSSGYLERREDPSDRRQQLVTVTAAGAGALDHMRELRVGMMRRLLAGLDGAELDALRDSVSALDREARRLQLVDPAATAPAERTPRA